jgi:hypothetical protein
VGTVSEANGKIKQGTLWGATIMPLNEAPLVEDMELQELVSYPIFIILFFRAISIGCLFFEAKGTEYLLLSPH